MALFSVHNVELVGMSASVPKTKAHNATSKLFDQQEAAQFVQTTGINTRRISGSALSSADLCTAAAQKLLKDINWEASEIEVLVFVTQTPDQPIPGTATAIQQRLELPKSCLVLDINQGCSGYVYGVSVLASLLSQGLKKGLLLVGDTITDLLDPSDKTVVPVFSDAGTATAMQFCKDAIPIHFNLQSDGSGKSAIQQRSKDFMRMNGLEVFNFGLREVVPNINVLSDFCNVKIEDVDYLVLHQANLLLNESIRKKLNITPNQTLTTLEKYGNTSNASIPLTIVDSCSEIAKIESKILCLAGFGVGLLWGSCMINTSNLTCSALIEL